MRSRRARAGSEPVYGGVRVSFFLDLYRKGLRGEVDVPLPPVAQLVGFTLIEVDPGRAVVAFDAAERHTSPLGTVQGGILCVIADAAMAIAYMTVLDEGESFTTIELKTNFLRGVRSGRLRAEGRVVRKGRRIGLVECDVLDEEQKLVARATSTCMSL